MIRRRYLNFDLLVDTDANGGYRARVLGSPAGETRAVPVEVPFSELELENLLLRVGQPRRRAVRGGGSPEVDVVRRFGGRLFDAVFRGDVRTALTASMRQAESEDAGVRVRLRLTDCPELCDLPWEYLYDPDARRFLALSEWTPVVRYLDLSAPIRPLTVQPPLRVLVMAASPTDFEPLDVEAEWSKVGDALRDARASGRVLVERVRGGGLPQLSEALRRGEYHVFHYIGHGLYDPAAQDGMLALEGPDGRGQLVRGADLGSRLHDHRSLRLAVLNSCEGARGGRSDPYSGTAQSLVHQGIPAVVAMQFEITDGAAITFAHSLYEAVADGLPLDAAVAAARNAVRDQPNPLEWATPVLYLRAPDGHVFDIAHPAAPAAPAGTSTRQAPDRAPPDSPDPAPGAAVSEREEPGDGRPGGPGAPRRRALSHPLLLGGVGAGVLLGAVLLWRVPEPDGDGALPEVLRVNFQSPDAVTPEGYLPDFGEPYGRKADGAPGEGLTYGWVHEGTTVPADLLAQGRERDAVDDQLRDTLVHMEAWDPALQRVVAAAWELAVPNGRYAVTVGVGDQAHNSLHTVNAEGVTVIRDFRGSPEEDYQEGGAQVEVSDGRLTIDSVGGDNTKINYLTVRRL